MDKDSETKRTSQNHMVTIDNNKKAIITGIVEVVSSTDRAVVAKTSTSLFQISGVGLRVSKLDLESAILHIDGEINKLEYNKNIAKGLFKRLFK